MMTIAIIFHCGLAHLSTFVFGMHVEGAFYLKVARHRLSVVPTRSVEEVAVVCCAGSCCVLWCKYNTPLSMLLV